MDSIDDLTCKLGSPSSDQQTNDTLSPINLRTSDIFIDLKKSIDNNNKLLFAFKDQVYYLYQIMRNMTIKENYSYQIASIIFLSEYQDNSSQKLDNVKQILQECTNLNLKTYFIILNNNNRKPIIKELRQLVEQFPCSLSIFDTEIHNVDQELEMITKELRIGSFDTRIFVHISTNKAMKTYLNSLITSLQKFEKSLTQNDKVYWSSCKTNQKFTAVEIQEADEQDEKKIGKRNKRKFILYGFAFLVILTIICYLLYVVIITFIQ
ncbi:unnamed protein product [Paramecium pentaurelia]|uniref:Transmembrane protein n=1 Tax=Paramecium pentaurelia TaxID=43138 RepID=A0A8S1XH11_9CILI|nr:unnamed protein product [Paramecium pentaurelia]